MIKKISLLIILVTILTACGKNKVNKFQGEAFGTYYAITYIGNEDSELQKEIENTLQGINNDFSIFNGNSLVSRINKNEDVTLSADMLFLLDLAKKVSAATDGAFDVTAGPLVNFWGFGSKKALQPVPDTAKALDTISKFVGYKKINVSQKKLVKNDNRIQLDFNAIAKGYAVDKLYKLMQAKGYENFVVDIGGEVRCKGVKSESKPWVVGIQIPTETKDGLIETNYTFELGNRSVATSGNYRNYKEENGVRYSHIINPTKLRPEKSSLLSVSVIANDCATADAYATAFMVLGMDSAMEIANRIPELDAHFIYYENGKYQYKQTKNFPKNTNN